MEVVDLLNRLLLPDNEVRRAAEQRFHALAKEQHEPLLVALFQVCIDGNFPVPIRKLAAVLLRRDLVGAEESSYYRLSSSSQKILLSELVRVVREEKNESMRFLMSEIAGELGGVLDSSDWPALPVTALALCKSNDAVDRAIGLTLLGFLADGQLSSSTADYFLGEATAVLLSNFQPPFCTSTKLVLHNVKALNYVLQSVRSSAQADRLTSLIPILMQFFSGMMSSKIAALDADEELDTDDEDVKTMLEELIDIADHSPAYFASNYPSFLSALLKALEDWHIVLSTSVKALIIEFLVTLCVGNPKAIRRYKGAANEPSKKNYFFHVFLSYLAELMTHFEEDPNWEKEVAIEELSGEEIHCVAEAALQRCLTATGASVVHNIVMTIVSDHLQTSAQLPQALEDPEGPCHIIAALQVMAAYMETSHTLDAATILPQHQQEVMQLLSHHIAMERYPRIRYAGYQALAQFLTFHLEYLSAPIVLQIFQALLQQMSWASTSQSPRVARAGWCCLLNLFEVAPVHTWSEGSIEAVLVLMVAVFQHGSNIVQEIAIALLTTLLEITRASSLASVWRRFYPHLMPACKQVWQRCQAPNYRQDIAHSPQVDVYASLLDAMSLLGEAAGVDIFLPDAREIMAAIRSHQPNNGMGETGEDLGGVKAFVRIARCLGADFAPYLSTTMHKISKALEQDVIVPEDADQAEQGGDEEADADVDMIESAQGLVAVRTSLVEEQITALQCLHLILSNEDMASCFVPYFEYTLAAIQKTSKSVHEDVRSHTLVLLPEVVKFAAWYQTVGRSQIHVHSNLVLLPLEEVLTTSLQACLHVLEVESAVELVITALQVLRQLVLVACKEPTASSSEGSTYAPRLSLSQLSVLAQNIKIVLKDSLQRRAVVKAEAAVQKATYASPADAEDGVEDVDEEALLAAQSLELHYHISEALNALLQTHSFAFYGIYRETWHELMLQLSHSFCVQEDRRLSMLVACDVLQFGFQSVQQGMAIDPSAQPALRDYLLSIFHVLLATITHVPEEEGIDWECRRSACFALSVLIDNFAGFIVQQQKEDMSVGWMHQSLGALRECIVQAHHPLPASQATSADEEAQGCCRDNAIAAVGAVLEQCLRVPFDLPLPFDQLLQQYLMAWPLRYDTEEAEKCLVRCHRMLSQHAALLWSVLSAHPKVMAAMVQALVQTAARSAETSNEAAVRQCQVLLHELMVDGDAVQRSGLSAPILAELREQVCKALDGSLHEALRQVLAATPATAGQSAARVVDLAYRG